MRKVVKGSLVTAISVLIAGIAIYTVGMIGGGREEVREMENNGDLDFITDHLSVRTVNGRFFWWNPGSLLYWGDNDIDIDLFEDEPIITHDSGDGSASDLDQPGESIDASEVTELDIELGAGFLIIDEDNTSDLGGNIRITVDAEEDAQIDYYVKKGTLHIEGFKNKKWNIVSNSYENYIYVTLPKDFAFQKSEIELGAGYMEINGGEYGKTDIDIGAGSMVCNEIKTGKMEAEVGAGTLEVVNIEASELDLSAAMGSVTISEGTVNGNIELSCDMGSLYLELQSAEEEFNYDIECSMGNILIGGLEYSGLGKEKNINNHAAKELNAECNMGSIEVIFTD